MNMKWDLRFIEMAKLVSSWSKDPSTQVGAVIVRPNKTVASVGFNGFPQSMPDSAVVYNTREDKYSRIIHAEINALIFCQDTQLKNYTFYIWPFAPCDRCCVQIIQAGITRIVTPKIIDVELAERWNGPLERTRRYCQECGVELVEFELES